MTVEGCPLIIEKDTVGMTTVMRKGRFSMFQVPLLHVGDEFVGGKPLHRKFLVKNNGSSPLKISWSVKNADKVVNGFIKFNLYLLSRTDKNVDIYMHRNKHKFLIRSSLIFVDDII